MLRQFMHCASDDQDVPLPDAFFLPLVPCEGDLPNDDDDDDDRDDVGDYGEERMGHSGGGDARAGCGDRGARGLPWVPPLAAAAAGPALPLPSTSSLRRRWRTFEGLLTDCMVIAFNAHVLFMPVVTSRCAPQRPPPARAAEAKGNDEGEGGGAAAPSSRKRPCHGGLPAPLQSSRPVPSRVRVFDPKVAGWLLSSSDSGSLDRFDFPQLYRAYCSGVAPPAFAARPCGHDSSAEAAPGRGTAALRSLHEHLVRCFQLGRHTMQALSEQGVLGAAQELEMPLVPLLAAMEARGVGFRPEALMEHRGAIDAELARLSDEAQRRAGKSFNVASAGQASGKRCG